MKYEEPVSPKFTSHDYSRHRHLALDGIDNTDPIIMEASDVSERPRYDAVQS